METVDVLGDHGLELSRLFQLRQFPVGGVGLRPLDEHFFPIKPVEFPGVLGKEGVTENGLRGIGVGLVIQAVHTAEVGDSAFRGDPGPAEKDDVVTLVDPLLQGSDVLLHNNLLARRGAASR